MHEFVYFELSFIMSKTILTKKLLSLTLILKGLLTTSKYVYV